MKEDLLEYKKVLEKLKHFERKKRLQESKLLSPEYDYLEIDSDGLLVDPYPVFDSKTFTYDKVIAAGIELGKKRMMLSSDNSDYFLYYEARNEINAKVGRKAIYSDNVIGKNNKMKGRFK